MELQTPGVGKLDRAMSAAATCNASATDYQPFTSRESGILVLFLPYVAILGLVSSFVTYKIMNYEPLKNFRVCIFLRFLAIVDGLRVVVALGLFWVGLLLPTDFTRGTHLPIFVCSLYSFCKYFLMDVGICALVFMEYERMFTFLLPCLKIPWRDHAIFFTSHHQVQITNITARLLLLLLVALSMNWNLDLLNKNLIQSRGVTSLGQRLNIWRFIGDENENFAKSHMPKIKEAMFAACCLLICVIVRFWLCWMPCLAIQETKEPIPKTQAPNVNDPSHPVERLQSNERKTPSVESVGQNATQHIPSSDRKRENFFTLDSSGWVFNFGGYTLGMCLVKGDKKAICTRNQEQQFDCMVLSYAFLYLVFDIPQIIIPIKAVAISRRHGVAFVKKMILIADIWSSLRPLCVFVLYLLFVLKLAFEVLLEIMDKALSRLSHDGYQTYSTLD